MKIFLIIATQQKKSLECLQHVLTGKYLTAEYFLVNIFIIIFFLTKNFSIRNQYHQDFTEQDINLLKKVCLLQSSDVPDSILSDLAKSKFQLNFGQILLAISNLQKVDKGHLINLLFGSQTRPIGLILKSLRR